MRDSEIDFDYCYGQGWLDARFDTNIELEREDFEHEEQWQAYLMGGEDYRESVR